MSDGAQSKGNGSSRFAAFISYAHADAAVAAKLQSKLERYRLPKRIAEGRTGGEAALGQIFRDREDLAAAPSLSEAIRAAIAEAEALVVICSPDAKASRWVGEEIALFRQLHPTRPILAALVCGEPEEAFPAPLTEGGTEPLAADLRAAGDGEALGFLKIVAGIAGVPLDALVQRDAQRRIRRVTAITAGALAAMLVMGIMTAFAIQSRNEAARQRAEAEGLVEYMLTDLRDRLRGVGRLEVMDTVNERAMTYYRRQGDIRELPAESLKRRARILHAMGEDYEKQGELDEAAAKFAEAYKTTAELLKSNANDPETVFAHGQSEYWVGRVAELRQDWPKAIHHYAAYADSAEKLYRINPKNPDYMMEMGWGYLNQGIVAFEGKADTVGARKLLSQSVTWFTRALQADFKRTEAKLELANAHAWLASTHYADENFLEAHKFWTRDIALKRELMESDPANSDYLYKLALALRSLARAEQKLGRRTDSGTRLSEAASISGKLVKQDGRNGTYRDLAIWIAIDRHSLATVSGQRGEANKFRIESQQLFESANRQALLLPRDIETIKAALTKMTQ